jgi:2-keto-4-pentenoate hydratase/2-oxohepta-3-ene-1,7-dioic acid hydratase in catechol pathway
LIGRFKAQQEVFFGTFDGKYVYRNEITYEFEDVTVLAPTCPSKIVCVGLNYIDHALELKELVPAKPVLFLKPSTSVIGPGENIVYPISSERVDYEGELGVVIGQRCKNVVNPEQVILGYTCFNDVTARDLQKEDGQWTRAKSFDSFAPVGPFVSTNLDPRNVAIKTRVNGRLKQSSNTRDLIFDVDYLIKFISRIMTLEAGDIIATGTPRGVGQLRAGDVVEVEIPGVGTLSNEVISEAAVAF